jgi:hypothetical protein
MFGNFSEIANGISVIVKIYGREIGPGINLCITAENSIKVILREIWTEGSVNSSQTGQNCHPRSWAFSGIQWMFIEISQTKE